VKAAVLRHSFHSRIRENLCFSYSIYVIINAIRAARKPNATEISIESEKTLVIAVLFITIFIFNIKEKLPHLKKSRSY